VLLGAAFDRILGGVVEAQVDAYKLTCVLHGLG
jgi:hypothetical protein